MNLELQLPPEKTATIQLYARIGGAAVGSPISGIPDGTDPSIYRFALGSYDDGDYDVQLLGVSNPNGLPFPMRDGVAYIGIPWAMIDATIYTPPIIAPPSLDNVCRVQLRARRGATLVKTRVLVTCASTGRLDDSAFASVAFDDETDSNGTVLIDLPWSSIQGLGKYRFRLIDIETGSVFHDRSVTVPDLETAMYEDLT
jgi:hypothetical protein